MNMSNIVWKDSCTPISVHFNDVYFNDDGAIAETMYVFIEGNNLNERFLAHRQPIFTIGETGFGAGLNFLIAWQQFLLFRQKHPQHILKTLQFFSCEKYPLTLTELTKIHQAIFDDADLLNLATQLQNGWQEYNMATDHVLLHVLISDISQFAAQLSAHNVTVDAWFFDGFSPAKNAEMWSTELFGELYAVTSAKGTFATFTAAGQVKRNLNDAGFIVSKRKGYGKKREMLVGKKNNLK